MMRPGFEASIEKLKNSCAVQERQVMSRRVHASRRAKLELQSVDRRTDVPDLLFASLERAQGLFELCDE